MPEPKDQRRVEMKRYMSQAVYITPHGDDYVSVEGSRVSLDMAPAEARELAEAILWAANGGDTSRSGTQEDSGKAGGSG